MISVCLRVSLPVVSPFEIVKQTPAEISVDIGAILRRSLQQSSDISLVVFLPVCVVNSLVDRDVILVLHTISVLCDTKKGRETSERSSESSDAHDGFLVGLVKRIGRRFASAVNEAELTLPR